MSIDARQVKERAASLGFTDCGVCEAGGAATIGFFEEWLGRGFHATMDYLPRSVALRADVEAILPGARSVVAVALNYYQENSYVPGQPLIARYALGRDYHKVMRSRLARLARELSELAPEAGFRACVDSAPVLEREWAQRSGLGWFGKNTCLINSRRGSWFFIGLLLTTLELEADEPAIGGCGTCRLCIDACPTGAIVYEDERWQVDARRCISYLTIEHRGAYEASLEPLVGAWTFGCDVCQEVCPFNSLRESQPERAPVTSEEDFARRSWPLLVELAEISEEDWDRVTRGSPVRRAGVEGIRRNARVNLENEGR
jgi:epoxyqueuosine reductase